jgi:hypothetical protein
MIVLFLATLQMVYRGLLYAPVQATNTVNVKDYGATGNGTTDDTPYIQNAINAATASGAGVFFPAGTYLHNSGLTFSGLAVTGVGPSSILLAGTANSITLTGSGPSIQNMQISTQGLSGPGVNIYVVNATSFTVANDTITQGSGFYGVEAYYSSIGAINSNTFNGDGSTSGYGAYVSYVSNCSVNSNVFQNEGTAVYVYDYSLYIAVQNNVIGNVTYPTQEYAIYVYDECNYVTLSGNTIQMANSTNSCYAIVLYYVSNIDITGNQIWGGYNAVYDYYPYLPGSHTVVENTIHNCGSSAIYLYNYSYNVPTLLNNNVFGECGLLDTSGNSAVITADGSAAYLTSTQIMNNSYQGHANNLQYYVYATSVPGLNISGNTQTQTSLPGNPNN